MNSRKPKWQPLKRAILLSILTTTAGTANTSEQTAFPTTRGVVNVLTGYPSAQTLASLLFPEKTRSIVLKNSATNAPRSTANYAVAMQIRFKFGSYELTNDAKMKLHAIGEMLQLHNLQHKTMVIEGHTDSVGSPPYNQRLSELRARSVKMFLINEYSINEDRLSTVGHGESRLLDTSDPKASINRRVQFKPGGN